jgi:hypothetical protein
MTPAAIRNFHCVFPLHIAILVSAELNVSPVTHIVATFEQLTGTGGPLISYVQHGRLIAHTGADACAFVAWLSGRETMPTTIQPESW